MRNRNIIHRLASSLALVVLAGAFVATAGCVEIEENYTLHLDGSGSLQMTISIDEQLTGMRFRNMASPIDRFREMIQEKIKALKDNPDIKTAKALPEVKENSMVRFPILIECKNVAALDQILNELDDTGSRKQSKPTSTLKIENSDNNLNFERIIFPREKNEGEQGANSKLRKEIRQNMLTRMVGKFHTIRVNLPAADISLPQGVKIQQDEQGDYLQWRYEMTELMNLAEAKRMSFTLSYPQSGNHAMTIALIFGVLAVGVGISFLMRKSVATTGQNQQSQVSLASESIPADTASSANELPSNPPSTSQPSSTDVVPSQDESERKDDMGRSEWQNIEL